MKQAKPDFYMGSGDSIILAEPRRCWRSKRLTTPNRADDLLLVQVCPPIPGGPYRLDEALSVVLVATRLKGDSLFPINTFPARPVPVYVPRWLVDDVKSRTRLEPHEIEVIDWADLYESEAEARAHLTYAQARKLGRKI